MRKVTATIIITYDVSETDYPNGMDEEDIREETGYMRKWVERAIWVERLDATIDDITVVNTETVATA